MGLKRTVFLSLLTSITFSSVVYADQTWDQVNDPAGFGAKYESNLKNLPVSGKLAETPWSDDYWPTYKGGITFRWNKKAKKNENELWSYDLPDMTNLKSVRMDELSPAEKYDIFVGQKDFPLTTYERKRTNILKTIEGNPEFDKEFKIPTWEGLCHAWAPGTLLYTNPKPVTLKNKDGVYVKFGSSDIKALLTYFLHMNDSETNFMGSRCEFDFAELEKEYKEGKITKEQLLEKIESKECSDVNAGAFHLVLANQLGIKKEGFVIDVTRDAEVWNQPVFGFSSQIKNKVGPLSSDAPFGTDKEVIVQTEVNYIKEVNQTWARTIPTGGALAKKNYVYSLSLDKNGKILGGKWLTEDRPDFAWARSRPRFSGYFKDLSKIFTEATIDSKKAREADVKKEMLKTAKINLIARGFYEEMSGVKAKNEFKRAARLEKDKLAFINTVAKLAMERKIRKDHLKKMIRSVGYSEIAKKAFLKELRKIELEETVKNAGKMSLMIKKLNTNKNINKLKKATTLEGKKIVDARTFINGTISDIKKEKALKNLSNKIKEDGIKKLVVENMASEVKKANALKDLAKVPAASLFINKTKKAVLKTKLKKDAKLALIVNNAAAEITRIETETRAQRFLNRHLIDSVKYGDLEKIKKLIEQGADVKFVSKVDGTNILLAAVETGKVDLIKFVLEKAPELASLVNKAKENALMVIARKELENKLKIEIGEILIKAKVDAKVKDAAGKTALDYANDGGWIQNRGLRKILKKAMK